jgi:DNA-binding CsgD family transcriptional regulator
MSNQNDDLILAELKKITNLMLYNITKELSQTETINVMSKLGFQPKEIAEFLGTTGNTVRVTLARKKKK